MRSSAHSTVSSFSESFSQFCFSFKEKNFFYLGALHARQRYATPARAFRPHWQQFHLRWSPSRWPRASASMTACGRWCTAAPRPAAAAPRSARRQPLASAPRPADDPARVQRERYHQRRRARPRSVPRSRSSRPRQLRLMRPQKRTHSLNHRGNHGLVPPLLDGFYIWQQRSDLLRNPPRVRTVIAIQEQQSR
jgi:hypothetical protein